MLPTKIIHSTLPATASVIWLHGLGASADDFMPMVPNLDLGAEHAFRLPQCTDSDDHHYRWYVDAGLV